MQHRHRNQPIDDQHNPEEPSSAAEARNLVLSGFRAHTPDATAADRRASRGDSTVDAPPSTEPPQPSTHGQTGTAQRRPAQVTLRTPDGRAWVWEVDVAGFGVVHRRLHAAAEAGHAQLVVDPGRAAVPALADAARPDQRRYLYNGPDYLNLPSGSIVTIANDPRVLPGSVRVHADRLPAYGLIVPARTLEELP